MLLAGLYRLLVEPRPQSPIDSKLTLQLVAMERLVPMPARAAAGERRHARGRLRPLSADIRVSRPSTARTPLKSWRQEDADDQGDAAERMDAQGQLDAALQPRPALALGG